MDHIFLVHSFVDGHLCCFHIFAIVKSVPSQIDWFGKVRKVFCNLEMLYLFDHPYTKRELEQALFIDQGQGPAMSHNLRLHQSSVMKRDLEPWLLFPVCLSPGLLQGKVPCAGPAGWTSHSPLWNKGMGPHNLPGPCRLILYLFEGRALDSPRFMPAGWPRQHSFTCLPYWSHL